MKKIGLLLMCISTMVHAQEPDSIVMDSVEKLPPAHYWAIYFDAALSIEPSAPDRNVLRMYGFGIQYDRWLGEFAVADQLGDYESFLIFPNVFSFRYRYAGAQLAYCFLKNTAMDIRLGAGYYLGDMLWEYQDSGEDLVREKFKLGKAFITAEFSKIRYVKPYLSVGYQLMSRVRIPTVRSADFSGWNAKAGIRIGFFNQ